MIRVGSAASMTVESVFERHVSIYAFHESKLSMALL